MQPVRQVRLDPRVAEVDGSGGSGANIFPYATSATSQTPGAGPFTFTTQSSLSYAAAQTGVFAISGANAANFMGPCTVTSYSGTTLVLTSCTFGGSGAHTDWQFSLPGTAATFTNDNTLTTLISATGLIINVQTVVNTAVVPTNAIIQSGAKVDVTTTSSSGTTYTGTMSPTLLTYTKDQVLTWDVGATLCTAGAITINIDTLGAKSLKEADGTTNPVAPDCTANRILQIAYDGTVFRIIGGGQVGGGGGLTGTSVTSTTPVTANANSTADQQMMELSVGAGYFNSAKQPFQFTGAGVYTTQTLQTPTLTFKVKLCTVSGCGSGTAVTLASIVSTVTLAGNTNNNWSFSFLGVTATAGATGNLEVHGPLTVDLGATTATADAVFGDTNTAVSSNIDLTAALFVDFTVTFSTQPTTPFNASTQRLGAVMPFAATAAPVTSVFGQTGAVGNLSGDCATSGSTAVTCTQVNGSNFTVNSSGLLTKADGITTAGTGVPIIGWQSSLTNSSATSPVTLATAPGAGWYRVNYTLDLHTPCTTGTGSLTMLFNWTANSARSVTTGGWPLNSTQGAASGYITGSLIIDVVSGNVTFTPTLVVACATGTATWDGLVQMERMN